MNKKFDCVEMQHQGADKVRITISKLSKTEELEFWKKETELLIRTKKKLTKKSTQK